MEFDREGTLVNYHISRAVIKSKKRFTYREAKEVLDGKKKSKHAPTLALMVELCGLLKKKRYERGSIEFAMPELVIIVDDQGDAAKDGLCRIRHHPPVRGRIHAQSQRNRRNTSDQARKNPHPIASMTSRQKRT